MFLWKKSKTSLKPVTNTLHIIFYCWTIAFILSCNASIPSEPHVVKVTAQKRGGDQKLQPIDYQPSTTCKNCHSKIYDQFEESMHSQSFINPIFKASFFKVLLPRLQYNTDLSGEVAACVACHSPFNYLRTGGDVSSIDKDMLIPAGVECDLCHTISGYHGATPGDGKYISTPSAQKLGPFQYQNDHHRAYSELQTKSEFCAICHNRTNRYGLEIISTYSEWKASKYGSGEIVECQDCHMTVQGFLTGGKPVYDSGAAAKGTFIDPEKRNKLYTHRFPGAHSETQLTGSVTLDIDYEKSQVKPGKPMMIYINIDNSKSGHKLPTGSAELRLLYLELTAEISGKIIHIDANSLDKEMFDVAGKGRFDSEILGQDVKPGSRVYRAICIDPQGRQTMLSFDVEKISFDNRLLANEIRKEFFIFQVPDDVKEDFSVTASLKYLRYPGALAEKLSIAKAKPIELAIVRKKIILQEKQ